MSLVVAFTAFALSTSVAQAQIPSIRRKAKDAGQRAVTGQPSQQKPAPKFDNTILELNPQVVGRLLKGLEARSTTRGAGGQTAAQLRQRSSAAGDEAANLNNQHSDDRAKWTEANNNAESCMSDELSNAERRHVQELQQRIMGMTGVNTPEKTKFMQDYAAAGQELQQAIAANDTAAQQRAREKMNKVIGVDPRADSAKARAKCQLPPVPPWMRRADSLAAISDTLAEQARDAESAGNAAAARAAEMTPEQFAMAAERAEGFVAQQGAGNAGSGNAGSGNAGSGNAGSGNAGGGSVGAGYVFTQIEEDALHARLAELRRYVG